MMWPIGHPNWYKTPGQLYIEKRRKQMIEIKDFSDLQKRVDDITHRLNELTRKLISLKEPPKQSAFQEWNDKTPKLLKGQVEENITLQRKEGWNAAIDAVLDLDGDKLRLADSIKALKEP